MDRRFSEFGWCLASLVVGVWADRTEQPGAAWVIVACWFAVLSVRSFRLIRKEETAGEQAEALAREETGLRENEFVDCDGNVMTRQVTTTDHPFGSPNCNAKSRADCSWPDCKCPRLVIENVGETSVSLSFQRPASFGEKDGTL